jgi:hypothetical protein
LVAALKCWYCPVAHALHALDGSGAASPAAHGLHEADACAFCSWNNPAAQVEHGAVDDTKAVPAAQ